MEERCGQTFTCGLTMCPMPVDRPSNALSFYSARRTETVESEGHRPLLLTDIEMVDADSATSVAGQAAKTSEVSEESGVKAGGGVKATENAESAAETGDKAKKAEPDATNGAEAVDLYVQPLVAKVDKKNKFRKVVEGAGDDKAAVEEKGAGKGPVATQKGKSKGEKKAYKRSAAAQMDTSTVENEDKFEKVDEGASDAKGAVEGKGAGKDASGFEKCKWSCQ